MKWPLELVITKLFLPYKNVFRGYVRYGSQILKCGSESGWWAGRKSKFKLTQHYLKVCLIRELAIQETVRVNRITGSN